MNAIQSLGSHKPSALEYLVAEGLLPKDAPEDAYDWHVSGDGDVEDELLSTKHCVVWSQHGVRRRVFRFEVEDQEVKQALLTHFPLHASRSIVPETQADVPNLATKAYAARVKKLEKQQRALVVLLQSQAHIYFLRGSAHTVNLPIDVEHAWPLPVGVLFQRRISPSSVYPPTPVPPSVPHNSFFASQAATFPSPQPGHRSRQSKPAHATPRASADYPATVSKPILADLPRLFVLKDPAAGLGLIVEAVTGNVSSSATSQFWPPSCDEDVLYASPSSEMKDLPNSQQSLVILVTVNKTRGCYSVWQMSDACTRDQRLPDRLRKKRMSSYRRPNRRSSYNTRLNSGAATPNNIQHSVPGEPSGFDDRRSFAGKPGRASRLSESVLLDPNEDSLFPRIEHDDRTGRMSSFKGDRRTTSMLARAEIASQDAVQMPDIARNPLGAGSSFTATGIRGQSFGITNERISFGKPRLSGRASTPGSMSMLSDVDEGTQLDADLDELFAAAHFQPAGPSSLDPFDSFGRDTTISKVFDIPIKDEVCSGSLPSICSTSSFLVDGFLAWPKTCDNARRISLYVLESRSQRLFEVVMSVRLFSYGPQATVRDTYGGADGLIMLRHEYHVQLRHQGILGMTKLSDGSTTATVVLHEGGSDGTELMRILPDRARQQIVQALCPSPQELSLALPASMQFHAANDSNVKDRKPSQNDTMSSGAGQWTKLARASSHGRFDIEDSRSVSHRCQIKIQSRHARVRRLIRTCKIAINDSCDDDLTCSWWYIRQLSYASHDQDDWRSAIVLLLGLVLSLANLPTAHPGDATVASATERPLREYFACSNSSKSSPWDWAFEHARTKESRNSNLKQELSSASHDDEKLLMECVRKAQDMRLAAFSAVEKSESMLLNTHDAEKDEARGTALQRLVLALYSFHEEETLNGCPPLEEPSLSLVLAQVARWLALPAFETHFTNNLSDTPLVDNSTRVSKPLQLPNPVQLSDTLKSVAEMPTRIGFDSGGQQPKSRRSLQLSDVQQIAELRGADKVDVEIISHEGYLELLSAGRKRARDAQGQVESMNNLGLQRRLIEMLPEALAAPLREDLSCMEKSPPAVWAHRMLTTVARKDIKALLENDADGIESTIQPIGNVEHHSRDLQSICKPDEHLAVPSITRVDQGDSLLRHVYREDRRWHEAAKLVDPVRVASTIIQPQPGMTEATFLDSQKDKAQLVYHRTMALPSGQAIMRFANVKPIMTEKVKISTFNTTCTMQPSNNSVNADKSNFTEEKVGWAFFHAGVNAGLQISPDAQGIDTSWIVLNKPSELGNRHAGLLLALGLNGHLRKMAKWLAFKYLTTKHTMTSVGLLLGLSASHLGTMDSLVTRLLSVHVSRLLPVGAAELNLSPLTQTAGVIGVGLLYYNSQHRRMSEVMLSEIEHVENEDLDSGNGDYRDEAYRLAAGFALGLINLGKGTDLRVLHDLRVTERLLAVATGPRDIGTVHILDRATAGATLAIALIFMKTNDEAMAKEVDVPKTIRQFETIRPDILMLRTVAKWLIMWDRITPSLQWVKINSPKEWRHFHDGTSKTMVQDSDNIPFFNVVAGLCWAIALKHAGTNSEAALAVLTHYHIIVRNMMLSAQTQEKTFDEALASGTLARWENHLQLSLATIAAGSGNLSVLRTLRLHHADLYGKSFGQHQTTAMAIGLLFMGHGRYTLCTSSLAVAAMLISFYPLTPNDVLDNRAHLQALRHFWVFAAEPRCLIPRDVETREVLEVPMRVVLQSTEAADLQERDGVQCATTAIKTAPILLPELTTIARIEVLSPQHWPVTLDFESSPAHLDAFRRHQTVFLKRKPLLSHVKGNFGVALSNAGKMPGLETDVQERSQSKRNAQTARSAVQWIFDLPAFREVGVDGVAAEVVPLLAKNSVDVGSLLDIRTTAVDDMMILAADAESEDIWRLKALKALLEREERGRQEDAAELSADEEEQWKVAWLRPEWVQGLRGKAVRRAERVIAEMSQGNKKASLQERSDKGDVMITD